MMNRDLVLWGARSCTLMVGCAIGSCSDVPEERRMELSATQTAIEVIVEPPPDVNCFNLTLRDQNGIVTQYQVALEPTMRFRDIAVGAYSATAQAYQAADCTMVPLNSPWGTKEPTDVIVMAGEATIVTLELFKLGRVVVNSRFVETAEVVAEQQGPVGTIAALGNNLAWVVNAGNDAPGSVVAFTDNHSPDDTPVVVAADQPSPGDINIEPGTGDIYWTNMSSGATDANGNPIFDGSVWRYSAATGTAEPVASNEDPFEIAAAADAIYWVNGVANDLLLFTPSTSTLSQFIAGQAGPNSIALVPADAPTRLFWTTTGDGAVRFVNLPDTTPIDVFVTPDSHVPISVAADEAFAYWTDFDNALGGSRIVRAPLSGGPAEVLFPPEGEAPLRVTYNIEVSDGFVYVNSVDGVKRIAKDGSTPLEIIQTGQTGGLALTTYGGVPYIYWTDGNFGGLIWRARLE